MAERIPDAHSRLAYLPTLDGWRAIAITMVLVAHAARFSGSLAFLEPIQFQCYLGVDIFFAISGILICSRLLHEEQLTGSLDLRSFYVRRTFRIFPALYLYLGVLAILAVGHVVPMDWAAWGSAAVFLRNYFTAFVRESYTNRFTSHFWSLAIEEHFYLLLPSLLFVFPRRRKIVLAGLVLLCLLWVVFYLRLTPPMDRQLHWERRTDLRLNSLLFPALLALVIQDNRARALIAGLLRPALVGAMLLAALFAQHARRNMAPRTPVAQALPQTTAGARSSAGLGEAAALRPSAEGTGEPAGYAEKDGQLHAIATFVVPFAFPLLILATMLHPRSVASRLLEWGPLRALGKVSYSLYLWQQLFWTGRPYVHWPIRYLQQPVAGALLTAMFTVASYWWIERPMIQWGRRLTTKGSVAGVEGAAEKERVPV